MQKKSFEFFLAFLFYTCCLFNTGYGQITGTHYEKGDSSFIEKPTGFYNVTTFSPLTFDGQFLSGVQTICGYKINKHLSIGGGIGYERFISILTYDNFKANLSILPIFADIRYTFPEHQFSPVIAIDGGYKFLLNKAGTQTRYDTTYSTIDLEVSSRNDLRDYNIFNQGGPFITAEAGIKAKVYRRLALYLAFDYSLWRISGDYYLTNRTDLLGSDNNWVKSGLVETMEKSVAYVNVFLVRLGISF
jgi:hypothetical protein